MTGADRLIFLGWLLQGALCSTWSAWMPQNIQALHGSCVLIPCTFQIPSDYDKHLINPVGMWWSNRGAANAKIVFFSNKTENDIQGNITGDLFKRNCTTVLNNILSRWAGIFSFRIEGNSSLKYNFAERVEIDLKDSPPSPQITINRDMVKEEDSVTLKEGDSVTLTCSAPAPCPSLPPTLSWTPSLSHSITVFQENDDHTKHVSSVMTFTASHKQEVKCTAVYRLQADNSERTSHTNVTLNVQSVKAPPTWIGATAGAAGMILTCILLTIILKKSCIRRKIQETVELSLTIQCENDTPVIHYASIDHKRETEQETGTIRGSSQKTEYAEVNLNRQKEEGRDEMSEVQEEQEQYVNVLGVKPGPSDKKKTRQPEHRDVSGCGFRAQNSTETQKRKTKLGVEQETMEDRKSSGLDDQLYTPEPKEEATYGNICRQLGTKGPDKG